MILNMGPHHPSTHGVLRLLLEIDGETIVRIMPDIGYLHTGIEKTCEAKFYQQVVPLTDRIDYLCPLTNNLCYVLAVEKLLGLEIPPKAQWMRVMLNELHAHQFAPGLAGDARARYRRDDRFSLLLPRARRHPAAVRDGQRTAHDDFSTSASAGWRSNLRWDFSSECRISPSAFPPRSMSTKTC